MATIRVRRVCAVCGTPITWQRKWSRSPYRLKYCSEGCRQRGLSDEDQAIERKILELLDARPVGASICPSEVARALRPLGDWRALMEPVRQAARRLQRAGRVQATQRGQPVDLSSARGPIRLRLKPQAAIQL